MAHFHVNWLAPVKIRRTLIGGSEKMIEWDDMLLTEKLRVFDKGITLDSGAEGVYQLKVGYRAGDMWAPHIPNVEALRVEAEHLIDCVTNKKTPIADGQAGLRVVRILEAASESMAKRGVPVELNLK
jgi:predicted dehydrogenase